MKKLIFDDDFFENFSKVEVFKWGVKYTLLLTLFLCAMTGLFTWARIKNVYSKEEYSINFQHQEMRDSTDYEYCPYCGEKLPDTQEKP